MIVILGAFAAIVFYYSFKWAWSVVDALIWYYSDEGKKWREKEDG